MCPWYLLGQPEQTKTKHEHCFLWASASVFILEAPGAHGVNHVVKKVHGTDLSCMTHACDSLPVAPGS